MLNLVEELAAADILDNCRQVQDDDLVLEDDLLALADEIALEDLEEPSSTTLIDSPAVETMALHEHQREGFLADQTNDVEGILECALCHEARPFSRTVTVRARRVCEECYTHLLSEADKRRDDPSNSPSESRYRRQQTDAFS